MLTNSTRIEEIGLIADNRHNAFKVPTEEEVTCFVTDVDNQDIKEVAAGFDGYQNVGQTSHSTETTVQITEKKPHYLTAIAPACKIIKIFYEERNFSMVRLFLILSTLTFLDTGAFSRALSIKLFNFIMNKEPSRILESSEVFPESVKLANGRVIRVGNCDQINLITGNCQIKEEFLILKI